MIITSQDLVIILFLIFLEGILSIDNALVLALLARELPPKQRKKALTYGLVGAVLFRLLALSLVTYLVRWNWVKFVGGGYLVYIAVKSLLVGESKKHGPKSSSSSHFWKTVLIIELTDIAFALDSIMAAVAMTPKFWIIFTGGVLGVIMMRFAASAFIKILEKFPSFEKTAYLLVLIIGIKVILEGLHLPGIDFHAPEAPSFWIFWGLMAAGFLYGFKPAKKDPSKSRDLKKLDDHH
ncbi:MAG: hypothetical protein H7222_07365 [Methylotenera sp.]|nr:hypothetical protein [Oligoflexia bacterium]